MRPMLVLDPGHAYKLCSLDGGPPQRITFVKRVGDKYPGNDAPAYGGTTLQEVLRACLDRARYVNRQIPCWQTRMVIRFLAWSIYLLEHRAARRHRRRPPPFAEAIGGKTCPYCGHVGCPGIRCAR